MPTRKTFKRKTRRGQPDRWTKYMSNTGKALALANTALHGVRQLKGIINSEKKYHTVSISGAMSSSGSVQALTAISQGDTNSTREGNSLLLKSLYLRMCITQHSSAVSTFYRLLLIKDLQQVSDTSPGVTDIISSATIGSGLNKSNAGRFQVLHEFVFSTDNSKTTTRFIKKYIPQNFHIRYNGTTSTDIQKNGLYLVYLSDQGTNTPNLNATIVSSFYDN